MEGVGMVHEPRICWGASFGCTRNTLCSFFKLHCPIFILSVSYLLYLCALLIPVAPKLKPLQLKYLLLLCIYYKVSASGIWIFIKYNTICFANET